MWLEIHISCMECIGPDDPFRIVAAHSTEANAKLHADRPPDSIGSQWKYIEWEKRDGVGWFAASREWATILIPADPYPDHLGAIEGDAS